MVSWCICLAASSFPSLSRHWACGSMEAMISKYGISVGAILKSGPRERSSISSCKQRNRRYSKGPCAIALIAEERYFYSLISLVFMLTNMDNAIPSTRAQSLIYPEFGIEFSLPEFLGSQVPSNRQVLQHFFHFSRDLKESVNNAFMQTAKKLLARWNGCGVKLRHPRTVADSIRSLHTTLL